MTKEELRRELQSNAFHQLLENHRVIVNWATGVGKSRVAINFVDYLDMVENKKTVLLLVGETAHKNNWKKEFLEALGQDRTEELLKNIRMECYNSLAKCTDTHWDLVVADEGHHLRSDKRVETLRNISADRMLVLSATLSERGDGEKLLATLNEVFGGFVSLNYDTQDAIDDGVLPPPTINVIPLHFWDKAEQRYDNITEYLERKKKEYLAAMRDDGFFAKSADELEAMKGRMLHAGSMRKQYLGRLKTKMAREILDDFEAKGLRYLCFCANIEQADKLGGVNIINSKQSQKVNKQVIENFNDGVINSLFAVGMLQEGVSLKNIQAGLIIQVDGKARPFIQRFGRILRSEKPILDIIYVPDSRDEDYLYNALKDVKQEYINGWTIQDYVQKHGIFEMKEISTMQLVGPPASYEQVRRFRTPYLTEISGARFLLHDHGNTYDFGPRIEGTFGGVMTDPQRGFVYITVYAQDKRSAFALRLPWKSSLGVLMPLATAPVTFHKPIRIVLLPDGNFAKTVITLAGNELQWAKVDIPKDDPAQQGSLRLNLINNLIERIHVTYLNGKTPVPQTAAPVSPMPLPQAPACPEPPAPFAATQTNPAAPQREPQAAEPRIEDHTDALAFGERVLGILDRRAPQPQTPFPSSINLYHTPTEPVQGKLPLWQ